MSKIFVVGFKSACRQKVGSNGSGIAEGGDCQHHRLIELQMLNYFRQPNSIVSTPLFAIPCCAFVILLFS